jgi:hypothetical protein
VECNPAGGGVGGADKPRGSGRYMDTFLH